MKKVLISLLLITSFLSQSVQADESPSPGQMSIGVLEKVKEADHVFFLIQKRLSLMHEVARWKWNNKAPIEDLPREQEVLKQIGKLATAYGLNKTWAVNFFQAQMDAAKMIQQRDFENWTDQGVKQFESPADLHKEIRPYLDRLTKELIQALVDSQVHFQDGAILTLIPPQPLSSRPYDTIDDDVWQKAIEPFYEMTP